MPSNPPGDRPRTSNRLRAVVLHCPYYTISTHHRLSRDCGCAASTIGRLMRNESKPSYRIACAVTEALARRLKCPLGIQEVFSTDGTYPTACVCDLTPDCHGCFPPEAYDDDDNLKPEYRDLWPGDWCRYPVSGSRNNAATAPSISNRTS